MSAQLLLDTGSVPASVTHLHVTAVDARGGRTASATDHPVVPAQPVTLPAGTVAVVLDFHAGDDEQLGQVSVPVDAAHGDLEVRAAYLRAEFLPERLAVVEVGPTGNLLVRGNQPLARDGDVCFDRPTDGTLCFPQRQMQARLRELLADPALDLDDFEIVEVVLQTLSNRNEITYYLGFLGIPGAHVDWPLSDGAWPPEGDDPAWAWTPPTFTATRAARNPRSLEWRPVYACGGAVPCTPAQARIGLVKVDFAGTPGRLQVLLEGTPDPASGKSRRLVYFHCTQGTDRTGAVHLAYMLHRNPSMGFLEALRRATLGMRQGVTDESRAPFAAIHGLKPSCTYVGLANAYCLDLAARSLRLAGGAEACLRSDPAGFRSDVAGGCND